MTKALLDNINEFEFKDRGQSVPTADAKDVSVIIVGGGFSGIALGAHLRRRGINDFLILDRNGQFGGCWSDNTYPGVACDVPSHLYSLSFRPNPRWSRVFSKGPEIRDYLEDVAREEHLDEHYRTNTNMTGAHWDSETKRWTVETSQGTYTGQFLITATGHLIDPKLPNIDGLAEFPGAVLHSAAWDHDVDIEGKKIAVIGTGASAIQLTPEVAKVAEHVTVFQRTPAYLVPRHDHEYTGAQKRTFERSSEALREERANIFWNNEQVYPAMRLDAFTQGMILKQANDLRHRLVEDTEIRQKLTPDYEPGCKRMLLAEDFYKAFNRDNVDLEDSALDHVEGSTLVSANGTRVDADVIVLCTGFDVAEPKYAKVVYDEQGRSLSERWGEGAIPGWTMFERGFPNLVAINARNTGLGHNSLIHIIESQVSAVAKLIEWATDNDIDRLEITEKSQEEWNGELAEKTAGTVWIDEGGCGAWYIDPRTKQLTALWPGYAWDFRRTMEGVGPELFEQA